MPNHKERSVCCGGGGGGVFKPQTRGRSLSELRVLEAMDTGAEIIATACPYCIRMLNEAIATLGVQQKIEVCDVAELLVRSIDNGA